MNYLDFAIRNIRRHKKRSLVTIFTICLGFTALGIMGGILNNIFSRLKEQSIITEKLGHITFAKEGFYENGKLHPEEYLWNEKEMKSIISILENSGDVELATPRLSLFGIASNGEASTIFITEAIVPEDDHVLIKTNVDGRTDREDISLAVAKDKNSDVAIGSELSSSLKLKEGDYLTLLTTTKDGIANAADVDIKKVYNTGNPANNDKYVLSNFYMAQELYDTKGAERIVVTLKEPKNIGEAQVKLNSLLKAAGYKVESKTWDKLSLTFGKVKTMFEVIFRVLTMIITVIVLLTLLNTMQMAVTERTREIGTIRAIGVLRKNIIKLFCAEGIIMGIIGCLLALPILFLIAFILKTLNVTFIPPVASTEVPIALILKPSKIVPVFVLFVVASLVSAFLASRKIAKQKVVISLSRTN
ncbi:ABC transporter permease [Flavivirga jejuensis]|uniref:FtsX-like permease family protein n=1 Tax=Flavivirga jejuensis TaxID=870487 RepID=A0ABT8WMM7_9FLAO|nr:FtsX-like permease family protein [Flavivirga jejuensis]MDO5974414.1 FtsX-like permease family protein [Flavivirga jejuensis]